MEVHEMGISGKTHHFGKNPKGVPFGFCPLLKSANEGFNLHFLTRMAILKFASTKGILLRFRVPENPLFDHFVASETSLTDILVLWTPLVHTSIHEETQTEVSKPSLQARKSLQNRHPPS